MGVLRRTLVGDGRLPGPLKAELAADGLWLLEESLPGTITFRSYRAPGQRSSLRKDLTSVGIGITAHRVVLWTGRSKHVDVRRDHPAYRMFGLGLDGPDRVCLSYDPAVFDPQRSGQVEIRFTTPQARTIAELLRRV